MIEKSTDKILCVDDEENILFMFRRSLGREYDLYTANSAEDALALIKQHHDFALIISDYTMPLINGVEFLKLAREFSPNSVQIMLTGNIELDIAIKTINETNVFRYLPKPFPIEELRKVIFDALNQYRLIIDKQQLDIEVERKNHELAESNAELAKQKKLLEYELEMAKIVYHKLFANRDFTTNGLEYIICNMNNAGGDFLLTHTDHQNQSYYVMLGDLTGHSLSSALAVLLVTEIFDTLCAGNPSLEQLASGINDKMCQKLPTGLFCAADLLRFDANSNSLYIWQGGMPEAYLLDQNGKIVKKLSSNNLPLGVLEGQDFTGTTTCINIDLSVASIFAYSDGVIEQNDGQNVMFGYQRLQNALISVPPGKRRIDEVLENLRLHQQQNVQTDDISMFELQFSRLVNAANQLGAKIAVY